MRGLCSESRHLGRPHLCQDLLGSCSIWSAQTWGDDFGEGRVLPHGWFAIMLSNTPTLCRQCGESAVHMYLTCVLDLFSFECHWEFSCLLQSNKRVLKSFKKNKIKISALVLVYKSYKPLPYRAGKSATTKSLCVELSGYHCKWDLCFWLKLHYSVLIAITEKTGKDISSIND